VNLLKRLRIDPFTLTLLGTVLLASLLPVHGTAAVWMDHITDIAIAALFFLHGARLSREAVLAGALHWRLHVTILACTFVLFPLLGLALHPLASHLLTPGLALGLLFLCALPSTVQSSIAFTSMAGGNVPAAVVSASASSLLGVFLTPVILALIAGGQGPMGSPLESIGKILLQLLVPFVAGHLLRPWIGGWVARRTCASCHAVARTGTSPMETAPPFRDIVRRRSLSELENRFVDGAIADHPSMPDYVFRAREIDDLIAYLESLQAEERTP